MLCIFVVFPSTGRGSFDVHEGERTEALSIVTRKALVSRIIIGQSYVANNDMHELHQLSTSPEFRSTFGVSHNDEHSLANKPTAS